jgi:hypothetical protein
VALIEQLALAVVLLDGDARSLGVDRDHHCGCAVEALGAVLLRVN